MEIEKYDLAVIGSGPAGYVAAIEAAQAGKTVVLFEKENLGGVCLNKGCIPTKTIIASAEKYKALSHMADFGINVENYSLDFSKVMERKNSVIEKLRKSLETLIKSNGVKIVMQEAVKDKKLSEERKTLVYKTSTDEYFEAEKAIISIGSKPREIKGLEFDHKFILNSDDILNLTTLPTNITIVGSGAIGTEWARIFASFGVNVSVVELAEKLIPNADGEISKRVERLFKSEKINFYTSNSIKKIDGKKVILQNDKEIETDIILVATGRVPNSYELSEGETLVGDAAGEIQLAHYASKQATNLVKNWYKGEQSNKFLTPAVIYGYPEIAWVGETEESLTKKNIEYETKTYLMSSLGKARADGDTTGFIKVIADKNKEYILGAHIICKEASAILHQFSILMENKIKIKDAVASVCFAHPTYSEGVSDVLTQFLK